MSWAEIKKAVNSDIDTPLNTLITNKTSTVTSAISSQTTTLSSLINSASGFTKSTLAARTALVALGFTQRITMTTPDGSTIYGYWKNASVKSCSWDEANAICENYWKEINVWANKNGYGNICIFSRMPAYTDTGSWLPSGNTWTDTQYSSNNSAHYYWAGSGYAAGNDYASYQCVPVVLVI